MRGAGSILLLLAAAGCGGGGPATVTGDVFVVLDTGAEIDVVDAPVRLIEERASTDTALARLCAVRRDELARAGDADEVRRAVSDRAWEARETLLAGEALRAVATGADARFRIDSVAPGSYRVVTDAVVQGERWSWMEPAAVRGGDSLHVALGNHNADGDPFRCQLLRAMEADGDA